MTKADITSKDRIRFFELEYWNMLLHRRLKSQIVLMQFELFLDTV